MSDAIDAAVRALARGELIVYPTDTLFGLGARVVDDAAVARVFAVKSRPLDLPVSLAVSSTEEVEPWAELTPRTRAFLRKELPGAVTVLLPPSPSARRSLARPMIGPQGTVAVRIPDHPIARELARRAGPITCTSANIHGQPTPNDLPTIRRILARQVSCYLGLGPRPSGQGSRILDLTTDPPTSVRG